MKQVFLRLPALAAALIALPAGAGIHRTNSLGAPMHRTDAANIQFYVGSSVKAGAKNSAGTVVITADSDVMGAANRAVAHWNASGAAIHFAPVQQAVASNNPSDGKSVITIEDTPENRSVVGQALAVTVVMTNSAGALLDSDVILNPAPEDSGSPAAFSSQRTAGTFDLESVVTHELGHALGADHTGPLGATMFATRHPIFSLTGFPDALPDEGLSADDISFVNDAYPTGATTFGAIRGTVRSSSGAPIHRALVLATEVGAGKVLSALTTSTDGTYTIPSAPPGTYRIYAQPLGGFVPASSIYSLAGGAADTGFKTTFFGGNSSPASLSVAAGGSTEADITVSPGSDPVTIQAMGTRSQSGFRGSFTGLALKPGQTATVLLWGPGIDASLGLQNVVALGPGVTVRSAAIAPDATVSGLGAPLQLILDIGATGERTDITLGISKNGDFGLAAGAIQMGSGNPAASFASTDMKNAASYAAGIVAPGELFALFGNGLGPTAGVSAKKPGDDATISSQLGGVQVFFDGAPAPLLFVSSGQINGIVPFSVDGKTQTSVVVDYGGTMSAPVAVPVQASAPAIFTANYSGVGQGAVLNQDNVTVNSAQHPAHLGDTVVIYASGFGQTKPAGADGLLSLTTPLPKPQLPVTVQIDGKDAHVRYAGAAPGYVAGFIQVNAVIPPNATPGSAVPVQVKVGNDSSQAGVTIAVVP